MVCATCLWLTLGCLLDQELSDDLRELMQQHHQCSQRLACPVEAAMSFHLQWRRVSVIGLALDSAFDVDAKLSTVEPQKLKRTWFPGMECNSRIQAGFENPGQSW